MKHLLLLVLLAATTARAQPSNPPRYPTPQPTQDAQVFEVTQNAGFMDVVYTDPKECAAQLEDQARRSHWSTAQYARAAAKLPEGGYLTAAWARPTASQAAASNFGLLILDAKGKQLHRERLNAILAEPLDMGGTLVYPQSCRIPLVQPLPAGAKVFIIEAAVGKRYEYVIRL